MLKLLIVDDEADVCSFARSFFEARDFKVFTSLSGEEALELFKYEKPEIVLVDVRMKGMDGVTLLKEIKKLDPDTEVIMVSAIEDTDVIKEAIRQGAKEYITKPLILDELEKVVLEKAEWIKNQRKK
ncbi:MAG: response regulator [Candidatus Omnitrophica bacterium]|nr:response regulator [Candidatus Omnitrophota bacterium]